MIIVHIEDVRACGLCSAGSRAFARRHGIDWIEFLRSGVPAARLEAIGDAMALRAVERARARAGGAGGGRAEKT